MANDFPEYKTNCIHFSELCFPPFYCYCHRCGNSAIAIFDLEDGQVKSWCEYYGCNVQLPTWLPNMLRRQRMRNKFHWVRRVVGFLWRSNEHS
ncbi:hypothetical protein Tsubulata_046188 [Turnera subulata]|uniref:Uncharacterized protein n=1 Tax=Turnera subulata TaxID=218843 RepID=A0A9Q0FAP8_9ROSI|nr:hypothetical protein Tsubulata_042492 [Turnera subulata]KAJ4844296.1 hypothetical protein Tsubulata_049825 [Turnera subulata]KAJ4846256.1 hypothetical protein Tsubulata_046188 [Turnera subulata]